MSPFSMCPKYKDEELFLSIGNKSYFPWKGNNILRKTLFIPSELSLCLKSCDCGKQTIYFTARQTKSIKPIDCGTRVIKLAEFPDLQADDYAWSVTRPQASSVNRIGLLMFQSSHRKIWKFTQFPGDNSLRDFF